MRHWMPLLVLAAVLASATARAHDFSPGVLALTEVSPGRFDVGWTEPVDSGAAPGRVRPLFPGHCRSEARSLDCGSKGLSGEIRFEGMTSRRMQVAVAIQRLDSSVEERIVTGAEPRLALSARPRSAVLAWLGAGVEHILLGADHLAFLLGLMLLVVRRSALVATITAFTLAHSTTLALATLGWVRLPAAAVEATIAASVVLVAREALHEAPTAARRAPWAVALIFGLVHGLGIAGALRDIGLPERGIGFTLLWFNLGVELGQLVVVAIALWMAELWRRIPSHPEPGRARVPSGKRILGYAMGSLGAWWLIERSVALVTA